MARSNEPYDLGDHELLVALHTQRHPAIGRGNDVAHDFTVISLDAPLQCIVRRLLRLMRLFCSRELCGRPVCEAIAFWLPEICAGIIATPRVGCRPRMGPG
jgi:hypothetical protein